MRRTCERIGCGTILSRYNSGPFCAIHEGPSLEESLYALGRPRSSDTKPENAERRDYFRTHKRLRAFEDRMVNPRISKEEWLFPNRRPAGERTLFR